MKRQIKSMTRSVSWTLKELYPQPSELAAIRLSPNDREVEYDLEIVAHHLPQLRGKRSRTHRLIIEKIPHFVMGTETILDLTLDLIPKDFDWENPQAKAERVIFRLAYWIFSLSPDPGQGMRQMISKFNWLSAVSRCARKELGADHEIMPN